MMIEPQRTQDEQAATLLTQANLHRLRRQWDEATTCCMQVLYHEPENWSAHALLGDIYADQNRPDEAIQWYCMTLDIRPESPSVREKLSKLVTTRRRQIVRSLDPNRPYVNRRGHSYPNTWMGKTAWHWSAPERRRQMTTGVIIGAVLLALVVLPVLLNSNPPEAHSAVFTAGPTTVAPVLDLRPASNQTSASPNNAQVSTTPAPEPARSDISQLAVNAPAAAPSVVAPSATPQSSAAVRDGGDASLTQALQNDSGLRSMGIGVTDAQYDPSSSTVTVTFVSSGAMQPSLTERVLRDSTAVAHAALDRPEAGSATACTVRCLTQSGTVSSADSGAAATLTFTGTMTRGQLPDADMTPRAGQPGQSSGFSRTWWAASANAPS